MTEPSLPTEDAAEARALAAGSFTGAAWTLVSRSTGFIRVAGVAAVLGPTYLGNTFQAANLLPNLAFYLFTGALVTALVVPPMARAFADPEQTDPVRLARSIATVVAGGLGVVALVLAVLAPALARLLSVAVENPEIAAAQHRAGTILLLTLAPQVPLYGLAAVAGAVQIARGRFGLPHAAPAIENAGILATLLLWLALWGSGGDVLTVSALQLVVLGSGTTAAVALHAALQWEGARRAGVLLLPARARGNPALAELAGQVRASIGIAGAQSLKELVVLVVAGARAGGVVAFQVAYAFYNLVVAVGARTVAAAALPGMSRQPTGARYRRAVGLALAVALPAGVAFLVVGGPLAEAASYGAMSRGGASSLVAAGLAGLAVGVAADAALTVSTATAYAAARPRAALAAICLRAVLTCGGALAVLAVQPTTTVAFVTVLALSVSGGDLAGAAVLHLSLRARLPGHGLVRMVATSSVAAAAMAGPSWLAASAVDGLAGGVLGRLAPALAAAAAGTAVVLAVHVLLRSPAIEDLRS